ncbi:hypothetical protein LIER_00783 [Lithospermum erythrorhizon]|uniref:RGS1-HXK1-interacting protein 1 n=1 Tax=Lithospermum erythrorhizon TaxID=34254 RepID=A0AAV3NND9_LITER
MAEDGGGSATEATTAPPEAAETESATGFSPAPAWPTQIQSYISELDLPGTLQHSTDSAIRSARSIQNSSSTHLRTFQDFLPQVRSQYKIYEDAFFQKVKEEVAVAKENPATTAGIAIASGLLLLRGPRRMLFRQTLGRFRSEEAQFARAEKNVQEMSISVEVMRNESKKLLERAALAEKDMIRGRSKMMNAGAQVRSLTKSIHKAESEAADLMDLLREIPGRGAIKLRADVASMASHLRQQRIMMDKKIVKISELGVPV